MAAIALPSMMHAWQYKEYGKGMHQVELPVPTPGPKELLVKVAATSLNPLDYKLESGSLKMIYGLKLPITPCTDVAGTVAAIGEGVTDFAVGDRVAAWSDVMKSGGLAEYVVLDKKSAAAKLPSSVSFEEASGVVTTGITALQALRDKAGMSLSGYKGRVLVMAASGGVGIYAVQLAKKAGAHVTVTVGARNADLARSLGADDVIDYRAVADPDNPLAHPGGGLYDVILHTTSVPEKWDHFHRVLTPKGCVVSTIPEFSTFLRTAIQSVTFAGQKMIPIFCDCSKAEDLKLLVEMMGTGELKTVVDSKTPLKEADKAWERCLGGHATGKIVVTVP